MTQVAAALAAHRPGRRLLAGARSTWRVLVLAGALGAAGCAGLVAPGPATWSTPGTRACLARYALTDEVIAAKGVRDVQSSRVAGFAFLRSDRALASYAAEARTAPERRAWLARAAELDRRARSHELANAGSDELAQQPLADCREQMVAALASDEGAWPDVVRGAGVADDYIAWRRVAGLYPLTARFVLAGALRLQAHERPRLLAGDDTADSALRWYRLDGPRPPLADLGDRDALGIPRLSREGEAQLLRRHAPNFAIETTSDADRPGTLALLATRPEPDTAKPALYAYSTITRFGADALIQLVYTLWFAARPDEGRFDLYSGHLDGLTWRVTLDRDGDVLLYDAMHACGCYHMFFPGARLAVLPPEEGLSEPPWVPYFLPADWRGPPTLHLASGTHFLTALSAAEPPRAEPLALLDYDVLRSLPRTTGGTQSLFDEHGIVPSSSRREQWLLWPMGVRASGAMRQAGHHATAFVGRRHFDEARLLDRYFARVAGGGE